MTKTKTEASTVVHNFDEVPAFASEAEEVEYWDTHELGDEILSAMHRDADKRLPPPRPRTKPVSLRFDESTLERAKALAKRRNKGYQTLFKEFVVERLYEEEKREGLL
jgi:hypothetical protein